MRLKAAAFPARLGSGRTAVVVAALVAAAAVVVAVVDLVTGSKCTGCIAAVAGGSIQTELVVSNEVGRPLTGAKVMLYANAASSPVMLSTKDDGTVRTPDLRGPVVSVVSAPGHLAEPVPIGWSDSGRRIPVRLFTASAKRFVVHSAGDVMFGRRYSESGSADTASRTEPLIPPKDAAAGAEGVVSSVAPEFAAADFRTVNLETVVSDRKVAQAYPGKRFILNSATSTVSGLRKLGVDLAVLANNHTRDLLDEGVTDTQAALVKAGVSSVGAGTDSVRASKPFKTTINGAGVAVLAYSTVDGSFVNAAFPLGTTRKPADLEAKDAWQYEDRTWGFSAGSMHIPEADRRIGEVWRRFTDAEKRLSAADVARMWTSLVAVYPELQDWVARRGHGGAAPWDTRTSTAQIRAEAATKQLVMVQVHAGFQFQDAASENMRELAHQAIDAGADIVVAHHPHVLQGLEWYKGRLIAYSLGNFAFDQDFLSTFGSAFLRTVWEGDKLLEARLMPIELIGYRPVAVTDDGAAQIIARVAASSELPYASYRDDDNSVRVRPVPASSDATVPQFLLEHHTARLAQGAPRERRTTVPIGPHAVVDLPGGPGSPVRPFAGQGVEVGRDLFGWGHFEDDAADGVSNDAIHWSLDSNRESTKSGQAPQGLRYLHLETHEDTAVQTRPVARIALPRHRLFTVEGGRAVPADPEPSYSVVAGVRRSSGASLQLRLEVYHFDDSNPTEDPISEVVTSHVKTINVPADGAWHHVVIDVTTAELDSGRIRGNMVLPYLRLEPASGSGTASADVDDIRFVEWRADVGTKDVLGPYTMARNRTDRQQRATFTVREPAS